MWVCAQMCTTIYVWLWITVVTELRKNFKCLFCLLLQWTYISWIIRRVFKKLVCHQQVNSLQAWPKSGVAGQKGLARISCRWIAKSCATLSVLHKPTPVSELHVTRWNKEIESSQTVSQQSDTAVVHKHIIMGLEFVWYIFVFLSLVIHFYFTKVTAYNILETNF